MSKKSKPKHRRGISELFIQRPITTTLVMVADPEYLAIRIYRSVGFTDSESQLQAEKAPHFSR